MDSTPEILPIDTLPSGMPTTNTSTGIFPSLTDGYIAECTNTGNKTYELDSQVSNYVSEAQDVLGSYEISPEAVVIAAWACTVSKYIGEDDVSFYVFLDGKFNWKFSICRLNLHESQTKLQLLQRTQTLLNDIKVRGIPVNDSFQHESYELFSEPANTAVIYSNGLCDSASPTLEHIMHKKKFLSLNVLKARGGTDCYMGYQHCMLSDGQAINVSTTFVTIFSSLGKELNISIGCMDFMNQSHLDQLWKFNDTVPEKPWSECFHQVVERHALDRPLAQAIDAWDAQFTYQDLSRLTTRLAQYLQTQGVGPRVIVPICFERSAWAIVAMLAVSKAGGAFVSIPPYLPPGRRAAIIQMVGPTIVLTTSDHGHLWTPGFNWIPIEGDRINRLPACDTALISSVKPTDMLYVIFTSGSTGVPKGCMVSHLSFLNGALKKAPEWKFGPNRRVLQMLSHTFDMSLLEICTSLGSGACVCVPRTEEIEEDLSHAINKYNITLAVMTPSLARRLDPQTVPGLKVLCLGGEAFPKEIVTLWSEKINLFQFYGPSECSINSSTRAITHRNTDPSNIGAPNNAACWVVMPNNYNKLVPVGAIGELLVSGPIVGLGYLKDPVKTSQVFLDDVVFLQSDPRYKNFCCYKTGDLVRWNSDGTLTFCGRVDAQVKLHGQRLELGEVEFHLTLHSEVRHAVAIVPKTGRSQNNLISVISLKSNPGSRSMTNDMSLLNDQSIDTVARSLRAQLQNALPRYMVPTIWAFVESMPMSASGKIDRVRVRKWVEDMSETTFSEITGTRPEFMDNAEPTTHIEWVIQEAWSNVLGLSPQRVGLHQSFIQLGGNSILAQEVVAKCRKNSVGLTIMNILTCEGVSAAAVMATSLTKINTPSKSDSVVRFQTAWKKLQQDYSLSYLEVSHFDEIEDVYPCTSMQAGMFIGQIRKPGSYHLRFFYKVRSKTGSLLSFAKVEAAWRRVVAHHPSLRTIFVDDLGADADYHSVVIRQPRVDLRVHEVPANTSSSDAMEIFTRSVESFKKGSPFHRLTVCVCDSEVTYLMVEISHALVDGAAMEALMRDFAHACDEKSLSHHAPRYRDFVEYTATRNSEASAKYWTAYLENCPPCMIPVNTRIAFDSSPTCFLRKDFDYERSDNFLSSCKENHITIASAIRVAWALVLRAYTGSRDVSFTYVAAGRDVPIENIDQMIGLCLSIQPCRAQFVPDATLATLARKMQQEYIESIPYQHYPLTELKGRLYPEGSEAMFNTAVSMEWTAKTDPYAESSLVLEEIREQDDPTEYDLVANVDILHGQIKLGFLYWPSLTDTDVTYIANTFKKALNCFLESVDTSIDSISLLCDSDFNKLDSMQHSPLNAVEMSVLDAVEGQATSQPDLPGILSWDGEFSYDQMVKWYTRLAKYLICQGVNRGDHIVACLDKSCWSIITLLGIMKAGATFVAANPLHSQQRLKAIVEHCCARLVVTESKYIPLFDTTETPTIAVGKRDVECSVPSTEVCLPVINGTDKASIVYTSGTTGAPKGIVIDHGSLATSMLVGHGRSYKFSRETRTLQFASFTFDASLQEILTTLAHGGCICVPSEDERLSNLSHCINQMQVNLALFTPTVARLIRPQDVPCLKTLILCGEQMSCQDVATWADFVDLYNGYGPAETTICVSVKGPIHPADDPTNLGHAVAGTRIWITEVTDDNRLAPTGCVGQLVVESRQVSQGYLRDLQRTTTSFIHPAWLPHGRVYKTGDLGRRNADGSLTYCGRKDTQVKIRGQRVELGEVEHHVRECFPDVSAVVAEVIRPVGEDKTVLAAFLCSSAGIDCVSAGNQHAMEEVFTEVRPLWTSKSVIQQLEDRLPCYMVPAAFFAVSAIPITVSGKTDRHRLREIGSAFSAEQLAQTNNEHGQDRRSPSTKIELQLQQLWATVLNVDKDQISLDSSFFRLGGDSVSAMKVVAAARKTGIILTVADIFRHPHIDELGRMARSSSTPTLEPLVAEPFVHFDTGNLKHIISLTQPGPYARDVSNIENVLPATDVQAFYVARASESSQEALNYFYLDFKDDLCLNRLNKACYDITDHFSILRTIFVLFCGKTYQIILRKLKTVLQVRDAEEDLCQASDAFCLKDLENGVNPGSLFWSLTLIRHTYSGSRLIFRISHAQYDGMSWPLILKCFREAYLGLSLSPTLSFSSYVSYILERAAQSRKYWTELLQGSRMAQISTTLAAHRSPQAETLKTHIGKTLPMPISPKGITVASLVSSAWSLVLRNLTGSMDVVYGFIVAGRNASIPQIQEVAGPCMNTVPVRIRFFPAWTTTDLLHHVMDQHLSMGEADSLGFQDIVQNCTQWPTETKTDSLLQYHDIDETPEISLSEDESSSVAKLDWFRKPYAVPTNIEVSARPKGDRLEISITADGRLIDMESANIVLTMFESAINSLSGGRELMLTKMKFSSLTSRQHHQSKAPDICASAYLTLQVLRLMFKMG
ncbi:D-lysergyl-peptide-synthetase, putative [Coccidioides posadasii C735 delta SOWgp]|uniref:D-lysergyl-peptide-synthetase, putative n=1 Tax=Coccidioides posadasii (strain C735) TaxID=222929 RepID=C5PFE6_COCP7|nr:D-lysergyl-peptide-synthetase, putative [Coccidioides posadasii C735 delta SOWgp]EER23274.1 D-lysergyl-peptide-synthetase, putative [Coccidioides posadasii C735 delta SOWgp]|eukprot:XP_003065419.1 D-lysergyl-peptide-synthetase, putative [Coccidioides posadasii C735 delta SOWgp]